MPLDYRYEAVDAAGRRLNGTLTADSEKDARRKLFEQGLVVSKLQGEAKAKTNWDWRRLFQKRLSTSELILFTQQFRTLYMAGISLPEALRILHDQAENKQFKWVVGDMQRRVLEGESLHQAFSANRKVFSSLYCAMIAAGESSGALPEVLERLVYLLEHDASCIPVLRLSPLTASFRSFLKPSRRRCAWCSPIRSRPSSPFRL